MAGAAPAQANTQQKRGNFAQLTLRNRQMLADQSFTAVAQNKVQDVYATGFLAYLVVQVIGTITTGAAASGTWDVQRFPYNLMARLTLRSNAGFTFYDTEGFVNKIVQKYHRLGFDPSVAINPLTGPPYGTSGSRVAIQQAPTGAVAASTVYPILVNYLIPLVAHPDCRAGLLPLQNNATRVSLSMQLGTATDWLGAAGTLGTAPTIALTAKTRMEFFSVPSDPTALPPLDFLHRIIQDTQAWTASGDQDYRVPVNGTMLRLWELFRNAGVDEKFFTTANDPTTPRFGNVSVIYAASEQPEIYDFRSMMYQHRFDYLTDLSDGLFMFDFASGGGSIEMGLSGRDAYNTRRLTEFKTRVNTSVTPGAGSTIECIRQELQPRKVS